MLTINKAMLYYGTNVKYKDKVGYIKDVHFDTQTINLFCGLVETDKVKDDIFDCARVTEDIIKNVPISDCKLILCPLSKLTEEEKKEIREYFYSSFKETEIDWSDIDEILGNTKPRFITNAIDQLRLWNYDIDEMEKEGDAVYE